MFVIFLQHAKEYNWKNNAIIIASETISNGLYNFILPLRSQCLKQSELRPIVLLLESEYVKFCSFNIRSYLLTI